MRLGRSSGIATLSLVPRGWGLGSLASHTLGTTEVASLGALRLGSGGVGLLSSATHHGTYVTGVQYWYCRSERSATVGFSISTLLITSLKGAGSSV